MSTPTTDPNRNDSHRSVPQGSDLPQTLGALRASAFASAAVAGRSVKDELRANLIAKLQAKQDPLFLELWDTKIP